MHMRPPDNSEAEREEPTNPYAPAAAESAEAHRTAAAIGPRMPGVEFWLVSAAAMVLLAIATYANLWLALPLLVVVPFAMLRTCLVQWRRAVAGLQHVPPLKLLFTSTCLVLALGVSCTITFCVICAGGVIASDGVNYSAGGGMRIGNFATIWIYASAAVAFISFLLLFAWSIKWAS